MARTPITAHCLETGYPIVTPAGGAADILWTAADTTHLNSAAIVSGKTMLLARNVGATPRHVTITSAADPYGRTGDLGPYTVAVGQVARFGRSPRTAGRVEGGLAFAGDHVDVQFAVVTLP